jgi:hypothetical protein
LYQAASWLLRLFKGACQSASCARAPVMASRPGCSRGPVFARCACGGRRRSRRTWPGGAGLLVGRESELKRIEGLLGRVRSGCGAVAVLEGPAGIGKTALLAEAARRASGYGFSVLRAAAGELEREYAFGVVRQLFWPVVAPVVTGGICLTAPPGWLRCRSALPDVQADRIESRGDTASAGMHGLYWLTANLAERGPLLVAVDDAHWT